MRAFRFFLPVMLSAFLTCVAHVTLAAAQSGSEGFGRLSDYLPASGQDDIWRYSNDGASFEITNTGDPNAIQYFYIGPEAGTEGRRRVSTVLEIHPDSTGSAGLLYGLSDARDLYHMVTLDAQGMVRVFRRDGEGFRPWWNNPAVRFSKAGPTC